MAAQTVKVAVSLPEEQFREIESLRKRLKLSRSALIAQAIQQLLKAYQEEEDVRRYIAGYQKHPETEEEIAEATALARQGLAQSVCPLKAR
jgi:metal-responsive CopG/Arc/MetJ family transcriptional regulator